VKEGVLLARTLMSTDAEAAVVRVLNLQPREVVIRQDELLGTAEAVEVEALDEVAKTGMRCQPSQPTRRNRSNSLRQPTSIGECPPTSTDGCQPAVAAGCESLYQPMSTDYCQPTVAAGREPLHQPTSTDGCQLVCRPMFAGGCPPIYNRTATAHVEPLVAALPVSLTTEQRNQAAELLRQNATVFAEDDSDLGYNDWLPMHIDTGTHRPLKQPVRRQPYCHLPEIEANVQKLLQTGAIEPACSPWSSNVLLVRKKDGTYRFCVDYRKLNDMTEKDSYPLPRIDQCLDSLGGATLFSCLDLQAGYWQAALDPTDAAKTAFTVRSGSYQFKVLSMGLANAPSQFQRLMNLVLSGLIWEACLVYLDDVIIYSATFEQHIERLAAVLDRFRCANLKLKPRKCQLFCEQVHFLGHVISAAGVSPDPSKVDAVQQWPVPTSVSEVRSFLGLASYYRRFISQFADIARPLHTLTAKGSVFHWQDEHEVAFRTLQRALLIAPVLASPVDNGKYYLDTDASSTGLGAVLQQEQEGQIRVIAYASRVLSPAERNYCTTRRELLALVYGLKQFRQFLLGRRFVLRVDHSALVYLRRTPEVNGQRSLA